ncbi:MAG: 1-acyl-sn-glycerol-3-phosphate acyltransferase [Burkholderiaceae bacterium]|nr:1-acyl-sn-glycerol-3-phosphate acyltransferase [Burkholderiaceae bacterium]
MTDLAALAERPVQLHGSSVARGVLRLAGWRVMFDGLPARQGVLIVYPHTSNWDFVIGVFAKWSIGIPLAFWGKDSLFKLPLFGRWLRWIGGVPVDRNSPHGAVAEMVARLVAARQNGRFLWLALSPEGTRSYRESWRSGFYQTALRADVPLALAFFDYAERRVGIDSFIRLSGDVARDMAAIEARLGHRRGCKPQRAAPVRLPRT